MRELYDGKCRIVDMILGEYHLNHVTTTTNLKALKFSNFLNYIFMKLKPMVIMIHISIKLRLL